jgi:hypothetical protein
MIKHISLRYFCSTFRARNQCQSSQICFLLLSGQDEEIFPSRSIIFVKYLNSVRFFSSKLNLESFLRGNLFGLQSRGSEPRGVGSVGSAIAEPAQHCFKLI